MKESKPLPTDVTTADAESSAPSGRASAKPLVAVATALAVATPLLLAAPSIAEADSARSELAFLRAVAASKTERVEHPALQRAMAQAQLNQDKDGVAYSQSHIQDHWQSPELPTDIESLT